MRTIRLISIRQVVPAALALGMLLTVLPAATMAESVPTDVRVAEYKVFTLINKVRANHGLLPLRMADGPRYVARLRSRSMKNHDYFGHVAPNGSNAGSLLSSRGIAYSKWGEAIGWNVYMDLEEGPGWMVNWWKNSAPHRSLILDRDFNYVGVGVTRDDEMTYYTVVFVTQPDHTRPFAGIVGSGTTATVAASSSAYTVRWWGRDRRLATRTAGLHSFTLQRKFRDGSWRTVLWRTQKRSITLNLASGVHQFRVQAVDRRGNRSSWQGPLTVVVP